jgi:hypothetical protein
MLAQEQQIKQNSSVDNSEQKKGGGGVALNKSGINIKSRFCC